MITIAMIGTGNWGKNLVRNFAGLDTARLKYCVDQDEERLATLGPQYPDTEFTADLDKVLADPEVDGVAIAAPAEAHHALGMQAMAAGKHAYIEKPLAMTSEQAAELVGESERRGLTLMVGHLLLYHPAVARLKKAADTGELGDLHYIYSQRINLGVIRQHENALWSLAPHDISVALYLFGQTPKTASACGQCYVQEGTGIEDVVFANFTFPDGRMCNVHISWLDPHKVRRITVVGSKKMAVFDDMESAEKLRIYDKGVDVPDFVSYGESLTLRYGDIRIPDLPMGEPLRLECQHFVDCIEQGTRPLTDGPSGLAVVQALEAADKSLKQHGVPVPIASD